MTLKKRWQDTFPGLLAALVVKMGPFVLAIFIAFVAGKNLWQLANDPPYGQITQTEHTIYLPPNVSVKLGMTNVIHDVGLFGRAAGVGDFQLEEYWKEYEGIAETAGSYNALVVSECTYRSSSRTEWGEECEDGDILLTYATQPPPEEQLRVHIFQRVEPDARPRRTEWREALDVGDYRLITKEGDHYAEVADGQLLLHWEWHVNGTGFLFYTVIALVVLLVLAYGAKEGLDRIFHW